MKRFRDKSCWETANQLLEDINYALSDRAMLDALVANNLINDMKHRKEIGGIKAKWTDSNTHWLLTEVLPVSGELGFKKLCCLLYTKSNISRIGRNLCDKWGVPFSKWETSGFIKFYVDSSCKKFFDSESLG